MLSNAQRSELRLQESTNRHILMFASEDGLTGDPLDMATVLASRAFVQLAEDDGKRALQVFANRRFAELCRQAGEEARAQGEDGPEVQIIAEGRISVKSPTIH